MPSEPALLNARSRARFLPPLLWMALIALGSSSFLSSNRTGWWVVTLLGHVAPWASPGALVATHVGLRKLGHLGEFGILAVLWYRALTPSPRAGIVAFLLAAGYGGVDELRQWLTPDREAAVADVAVDALGAWLGLGAWVEAGALRPATLRAAAWGTGLLAGLAVLGVVLDSALGRPVVALGTSALGLGLVAAALARRARDARTRLLAETREPGSA